MKWVVLSVAMVGSVLFSNSVWAAAPEGWGIERGSDGYDVAVPPGGTAVSGPDGRAVAVPPEWEVERGPDGRAVAVPPGGTTQRGSDNRLVAIPEGWTSEVGSDGRVVAVPPEGTTERGSDGRLVAIPEGWTTEVGPDGRAVAVPPNGTTVRRPDGRLVAIPEGWTAEAGSDGRTVAVPPGGEIVERSDGMAVSVPPSDFDWNDPLAQIVILDSQSQVKLWDVHLAQKEARVWIVEMEDVDADGNTVTVRTGYIDYDRIDWNETLTDAEYHSLMASLAGQEADFDAAQPFEVELFSGEDESYLWGLVPAETITIIVSASVTD